MIRHYLILTSVNISGLISQVREHMAQKEVTLVGGPFIFQGDLCQALTWELPDPAEVKKAN